MRSSRRGARCSARWCDDFRGKCPFTTFRRSGAATRSGIGRHVRSRVDAPGPFRNSHKKRKRHKREHSGFDGVVRRCTLHCGMARLRRRGLTILLALAAFAAVVVPFSARPAAPWWAKWQAHRAINKFSAEVRKNLDATPVPVILRTAGDLTWDSSEVLSRENTPLTLRFPVAEGKEMKSNCLLLTYPQFRVMILRPSLTAPIDDRAIRVRSAQIKSGRGE